MSIEKLNEISAEITEAKKKLAAFATDQGKSAIGAAFARCFDPPSNLKAITWRQYTPHFNDGEACVFSARDPYLLLSDDVDDIDDDDNSFDTYSIDGTSDYARSKREKMNQAIGEAAVAAFVETWAKLDEQILEAVFGDHCQITITKDSVEVEEYEHD